MNISTTVPTLGGAAREQLPLSPVPLMALSNLDRLIEYLGLQQWPGPDGGSDNPDKLPIGCHDVNGRVTVNCCCVYMSDVGSMLRISPLPSPTSTPSPVTLVTRPVMASSSAVPAAMVTLLSCVTLSRCHEAVMVMVMGAHSGHYWDPGRGRHGEPASGDTGTLYSALYTVHCTPYTGTRRTRGWGMSRKNTTLATQPHALFLNESSAERWGDAAVSAALAARGQEIRTEACRGQDVNSGDQSPQHRLGPRPRNPGALHTGADCRVFAALLFDLDPRME